MKMWQSMYQLLALFRFVFLLLHPHRHTCQLLNEHGNINLLLCAFLYITALHGPKLVLGVIEPDKNDTERTAGDEAYLG